MKERFKQLCATLGYNQQMIAEKLSIDVRKLRSYIYETKNLPIDFLILLNDVLSINLNWLLTGNGKMFSNSNEGDENDLKRRKNINLKYQLTNFGNRVTDIQNKNNLSDRDFAKIIGIYEDEFIDLKQGHREPNIKILCKIKQSFDVSIDWLLFDD